MLVPCSEQLAIVAENHEGFYELQGTLTFDSSQG